MLRILAAFTLWFTALSAEDLQLIGPVVDVRFRNLPSCIEKVDIVNESIVITLKKEYRFTQEVRLSMSMNYFGNQITLNQGFGATVRSENGDLVIRYLGILNGVYLIQDESILNAPVILVNALSQ